MKGLLLAIESATDRLSVALLEGERLIDLREGDQMGPHSTALVPMLDRMLSEAGVEIESIAALGISVGPGSFTSLRIGLATAKGLSFGRPMPAVGVSTLEAMAIAVLESGGTESVGSSRGASGEGVGSDPTEVVALLDARRGEWYAAGWRRAAEPGARAVPTLAEGLYSSSGLASHVGLQTRIVSPEPLGWQAAFESAGVGVAAIVTGGRAWPSAEWVGRLAHRALERGEGIEARGLGARYVRRAQAEAARLGRPVEAGARADLDPPEGRSEDPA
ncbi:MAG: tRNA (adenosine(37)-N6)-threonylcarbamoyltransferase complex dimerization subunit type 1 TsaB [bacterium]